MTGKDLIIYIIQNGLEDEPVIKDGKLLGFMTIGEAAVKFGVGEATIKVWINMDKMTAIYIGETTYIPCDVKDPRENKGEENA